MYPPQAGTDGQGNVFIPFTATQSDVPFAHWQMVTRKVFESDGPISIQSVIITNRGEVFVQYAQQVNDENEYPKRENHLLPEKKKVLRMKLLKQNAVWKGTLEYEPELRFTPTGKSVVIFAITVNGESNAVKRGMNWRMKYAKEILG